MNNKGITLISLVVTIIVLLILAGITIGTIFNDNGIIKKAQEAANATEDSAQNEQEALNGLLNDMDGIINEIGGGTTPTIGRINGKVTWSTGSASLELTTDTEGVTIQYRKNSESSWIDYTSPVPSLLHGDKVYARGVKDGETVISEKQFDILDTTPPTVTIASSSSTTNSISATATATDNETGMGANPKYVFYIKKTSDPDSTYVEIANSTNASVTKDGLEQDTSYTIKVEVADVAGNKGQTTKDINTQKIVYVDTLKAGDYVTYIDGTNTPRKCVVLYDSSSPYGVEIITMETVEDIEVGNGTGSVFSNSGTTEFDISMNSYNNLINTLNSKASIYLNTAYASDVRSVGSVPNNKNSQSGMFTSSYNYMLNYNGKLVDTDNNYIIDYNQMETLNIQNIDEFYWLASRNVNSNYNRTDFIVEYVSKSGRYRRSSSM